MKRFLCLITALLALTAPAHAEPLKTTLGVPDRVTLPAFITATGLTTIVIDAAVEMPDVESVNTYEFIPSSITAEQALTVARQLGLKRITEIDFTHYDEAQMAKFSIFRELTSDSFSDNGGTGRYDFIVSNDYWRGQPYGGDFHYEDFGQSYYFSIYDPMFAYDGWVTERCMYSRDEARQKALDLAAQIAPDLSLNLEGIVIGGNLEAGGNYPTGHRFVFSKTVDGIPVTVTSEWLGAGHDEDNYAPWCTEERLTIDVASIGFPLIFMRSPHTVGDVVESGLTDLVPFETVMSVAQSILPLKMVSKERSEEECRLVIDRITFGYMRVQKPYAIGEFLLVPVWDFFGNDLRNQWIPGTWSNETSSWQHERTMTHEVNQSFLTIDARTGLVIDRSLGY